ncbi:hypothetical protein I5677_00960 [Mobilitalea sibirica]|uniref:Uncharacterized protein n=1 Tax=Mobilitalea sibirica TaxID=1462919 RepID=A0A8J7L1X2_9FIRM|nr:hypothetical protein [Mobilitalea sibirica]MBH1939458.1 hypothetical protein [Mobilitalea sibirica]
MKKITISIILLLFIISLTGCNKKEVNITAEDITSNTILVKSNGELQVAFVEDFDKSYYNLSELDEFVKKEISLYNQQAGSEEIEIKDLLLRDGKAIMLLTFSGMAHYSAFNDVSAAYFNADMDNVALSLPEQFISAKDGSLVDRDSAMNNGKYKVVVLYEPFDIIVEGSVKYYSENVTLAANNKVQSNSEDMTVVIYKP